MRYDTKVMLFKGGFTYNTDTGDYDYEEVTDYEEAYASVVNTDIQTMHLVYGEIRQGSVTMHLQNKVKGFDKVRIGDTIYAVDQVINLRVKQAYILSEIQGEEWVSL